MAPDPLPANVHISTHPCLRAKLSQLRSRSQSTTSSREIKSLVYDTTILGCEALTAGLRTVPSGTDKTPLDVDYTTEAVEPSNIALIPVLRSGLRMVEALQTLLPFFAPVHHLGLFRERTTLKPVEYYNKLPYEPVSPSSSGLTAPSTTAPASVLTNTAVNKAAATLAILLDPVTGGSIAAAIQILRDWGLQRVLLLSILGSSQGVRSAAEVWPQGVDIWVGALDPTCDDRGMIVPGLGDIGDRLFMGRGEMTSEEVQ